MGHGLHFEPDEIVGQQDAPELLSNAFGVLASDRLLAFEQVGLELVVAELKFPSFVVEGSDLASGVLPWIAQ